MAVIEGQIEPLKKIKGILHDNGITRFSSIGEINSFKKNYQIEKNIISKEIEVEVTCQIKQLECDLVKYQQEYEDFKNEIIGDIHSEIKSLDIELKIIKEKSSKSFIYKILCYPKTKSLTNKNAHLETNFDNVVSNRTHHYEKQAVETRDKLNDYTTNKDKIISERTLDSSRELENTKEVVDGLYPLIAGAIGENSVTKEVQKLPDNFHLFNDFSVEFDPPIYNKKEDDRIYSIQIDHLLVCEAGIFVLETKNWGKQSVNSLDLRSPIKQIRRSSFALFVMLNSRSNHNINLERHHWGSKQIPVRNLIVMTGAKPKEEFKHVKVLSLKELNGYITYFDPIFSTAEVESLCDYLKMKTS